MADVEAPVLYGPQPALVGRCVAAAAQRLMAFRPVPAPLGAHRLSIDLFKIGLGLAFTSNQSVDAQAESYVDL